MRSRPAARQRPVYQRAFLHIRRLLKHDQGKWAGMAGVQNAMEAGSSITHGQTVSIGNHSASRMRNRSTGSSIAPVLRESSAPAPTVREEWRAFLVNSPDNGWAELAAEGLEIRDVDGGHLNLLQDQHVDRLREN